MKNRIKNWYNVYNVIFQDCCNFGNYVIKFYLLLQILINASSSMVSSIEVCDPVMTNHDSLQHAIDTSSYAPNSLLHFQVNLMS